jgi:hypothetical protein
LLHSLASLFPARLSEFPVPPRGPLQSGGMVTFFLPKYHMGLNPIEQCRGCGKCYHHRLPPPLEDLWRNVVKSLKLIPLNFMLRYAIFVAMYITINSHHAQVHKPNDPLHGCPLKIPHWPGSSLGCVAVPQSPYPPTILAKGSQGFAAEKTPFSKYHTIQIDYPCIP